MKIAVLASTFPAVSQTFVLNGIVGLLDLGHDVHVFAEKKGRSAKVHGLYETYNLVERTSYYGIPQNKMVRILKAILLIMQYAPKNYRAIFRSLNIFRYGTLALSLSLFFMNIALLRRGGSFDVLHCQFGTLGPSAVALREINRSNCKIAVSIRGYDITTNLETNPGFYRSVFREGDLFLPVCEFLKDRLIQEGCEEKKVVVHYSGIDCSKFNYVQKHRAPGEPVKVLTIARLVEKKGVAFAIEAVSRLLSKGERIDYTIAGDGVLREQLQQMIERLGIERSVRLVGAKTHEEVHELLAQSHVLVAPSLTADSGDQEGIPNAIKEAMATGLPVISTFHAGIPELVTDGVSGLLVPERVAEALAGALAYLAHHPERCQEMGQAGRRQVEQKFDTKSLSKRLEGLYLELMQTT